MMNTKSWEEINEEKKMKGPPKRTTQLPPYNVIKMYLDNIERAVKDFRRVLRDYENGDHLKGMKPGESKIQTSENFYHG